MICAFLAHLDSPSAAPDFDGKMNALNKRAFAALARFIVALVLLLFLPAGALDYWQAWIFLFLFSGSIVAITVYVMKHDPKLLERRLNAGPAAETLRSQKIIQRVISPTFFAGILIPAIDHRFGWSHVPPFVVVLGDALVALGLFVVFLVFKENSFASAVIEVDAEQKVVSTGPYRLVRHPMYFGALIMSVGMPLALGSWWGLIALVPMSLAIVWRLLEEEKFLAKNLPRYSDYRNSVKYRLLPFIW